MKKYFTNVVFALLFAVLSPAQAAESNSLQIVLTQAMELGQEEVEAYFYDTKSYKPMIRYQYRFYCLLKNTGDVELTVATKNLDPGIMHGNEGETPIAELSIDKMSHEGSQVIPSVAELGLVVLRPGECAGIRWEKSSSKRLSTVKVQYNPRDIYDNRFGYWSGRVTGKPVEVMVSKK